MLPQPALEAGVELVPSSTSSIPPAFTSKPTVFSTTATTSTTAVPKSYAAALAAKSKKSEKSPAAPKPANSLRAVPKAKPVTLVAYPSNDAGLTVRASPNNVLQHMLKLGGWNLWPQMVHEMRLPSTSFASFQEYLWLRAGGSSFLLRHLHFIQPVYMRGSAGANEPDLVHMFRLVRLCWQWQTGACRKSAEHCEQLHLCRNWIAGLCTAGAGCALGHSFERTWVLELPISNAWSTACIADFIRGCHLSPCPEYNSALGCCDAECHSLHVCALFAYGQCADPTCTRSHDLRSKQCTGVFKFYSVSNSAAFHEQIKSGLLAVIMPTAPELQEPKSNISCPLLRFLHPYWLLSAPLLVRRKTPALEGRSSHWSDTSPLPTPRGLSRSRPVTLPRPRTDTHRSPLCSGPLPKTAPREGIEEWGFFCAAFGLPPNLPFDSLASHLSLLTHARNPTSFVAQHLHFLNLLYLKKKPETGVPDAINMFRFVRLCWKWQTGSCAKSANECEHLHLCRN